MFCPLRMDGAWPPPLPANRHLALLALWADTGHAMPCCSMRPPAYHCWRPPGRGWPLFRPVPCPPGCPHGSSAWCMTCGATPRLVESINAPGSIMATGRKPHRWRCGSVTSGGRSEPAGVPVGCRRRPGPDPAWAGAWRDRGGLASAPDRCRRNHRQAGSAAWLHAQGHADPDAREIAARRRPLCRAPVGRGDRRPRDRLCPATEAALDCRVPRSGRSPGVP